MAGLMSASSGKLPYKEIYTTCTVTSWGGWGTLITKDAILPNASTLSINTVKGQYLECTLASRTLMTTIKALKKCSGEYAYFQVDGKLVVTPFSANEGETILEKNYNGGILLVLVR